MAAKGISSSMLQLCFPRQLWKAQEALKQQPQKLGADVERCDFFSKADVSRRPPVSDQRPASGAGRMCVAPWFTTSMFSAGHSPSDGD